MIFQLDEGCARKKIYSKGCGVILLCGRGRFAFGPTRFSLQIPSPSAPGSQRNLPKVDQKVTYHAAAPAAGAFSPENENE